ncbi:hypothetical protein O3P69_005996 [Scylla paramamosain]|uniref:G-protein coupled receptors family 2 profile 2 domain-containing protein n=1 Tax=Scylla paramamosain TaxID=85552 RepID=A0AAW0U4A4_SCYPA
MWKCVEKEEEEVSVGLKRGRCVEGPLEERGCVELWVCSSTSSTWYPAFWLLALTTRLLGSLLQRPAMHTAFYCASAWGASLGLVVVSYVVNPEGYETRRYCWMSVERGMLVSFIVPVCSLILVNAGLCLAAQKLLLDMREGVKHEVMAVHKRDLRGAVCLLPLEGVSWFLAVVALEDHQSLALDCAAALVSACLGWLILYFHGWSWRCHGLCWLRHRLHSSSTSSTSSNSSRRMEDLSLPLTARYDHDLAHQPLLHPLPPPPAAPSPRPRNCYRYPRPLPPQQPSPLPLPLGQKSSPFSLSSRGTSGGRSTEEGANEGKRTRCSDPPMLTVRTLKTRCLIVSKPNDSLTVSKPRESLLRTHRGQDFEVPEEYIKGEDLRGGQSTLSARGSNTF